MLDAKQVVLTTSQPDEVEATKITLQPLLYVHAPLLHRSTALFVVVVPPSFPLRLFLFTDAEDHDHYAAATIWGAVPFRAGPHAYDSQRVFLSSQ